MGIRKRLQNLLRRDQREQDLAEEMAAHLEMEIEARMARGESREAAERAARLTFGNVTQAAEATREMWSFAWLDSIGQDLRFAARLLRKSPMFTLAAVASLALGIGANAAIYSVFQRVLYDDLAVREPENLLQFAAVDSQTKPGTSNAVFGYGLVKDIERDAKGVEAVTCSATNQVSFRAGGEATFKRIEYVCGNYFEMLGLKPHLGRLLAASDAVTPGAHPYAVISHAFWQSEFGGDPAIIGRQVELNRQKFTVIGVTPRNFTSVQRFSGTDLFLPVMMSGALNGKPSLSPVDVGWWLRLLVRRKAEVNVAVLDQELTAIHRRYLLEKARSDFDRKLVATTQVKLEPAGMGFDLKRRETFYGKPFQVLSAVVGVVLLIACINLANLLLARAAARQREIATRLAIGASRGRLVRQFMTESLLLAGIGGVVGLLLANGLEQYLMVETYGKRAQAILAEGASLRPALYALGFTLLAALGFGLVPAMTADRQGAGNAVRFRGRKALVSVQVALSVLLLTGAGLFLKTLDNLRRTDAGFDRQHVVTLGLTAEAVSREKDAMLGYYRRVLQQVRQTPGVEGVSLSAMGMLSGSMWGSGLRVEGRTIGPGEKTPLRNAVGAEFFTLIGAPLVAGRDFTEADCVPGAAPVAIVNESFARHYFPGVSAVGKRIGRGARPGIEDPLHTIVGVVRDLRQVRINDVPESYWYVPYEQADRLGTAVLTVRARGEAKRMVQAIRAAVAQVDPTVPLGEAQSMEMLVEEQIRQEKLVAELSAFFAGVALLLAVVGLYGVMAYTVERRTREIGIRMALGEARGSVLAGVMGEAGLYLVLGAAAGLPLAVGLGRFAEKQLYGVKPMDAGALGVAVGLVVLFGALAAYLTARRAASIEPMSALRIE